MRLLARRTALALLVVPAALITAVPSPAHAGPPDKTCAKVAVGDLALSGVSSVSSSCAFVYGGGPIIGGAVNLGVGGTSAPSLNLSTLTLQVITPNGSVTICSGVEACFGHRRPGVAAGTALTCKLTGTLVGDFGTNPLVAYRCYSGPPLAFLSGSSFLSGTSIVQATPARATRALT